MSGTRTTIDPMLQVAALFNNRNWSGVIEVCTSVLKKDKEETWALDRRGIAYSSIGQYDLAIKDFTTYYKLEPKSESARSNCAIVLIFKGDYTAALQVLDERINPNPLNQTALYYRGTSYYHIGQYSEAIKHLNALLESLRIDDLSIDITLKCKAHLALCLAHCKLGDFTAAEKHFSLGKNSGLIEMYASAYVDAKLELKKLQKKSAIGVSEEKEDKIFTQLQHEVREGSSVSRIHAVNLLTLILAEIDKGENSAAQLHYQELVRGSLFCHLPFHLQKEFLELPLCLDPKAKIADSDKAQEDLRDDLISMVENIDKINKKQKLDPLPQHARWNFLALAARIEFLGFLDVDGYSRKIKKIANELEDAIGKTGSINFRAVDVLKENKKLRAHLAANNQQLSRRVEEMMLSFEAPVSSSAVIAKQLDAGKEQEVKVDTVAVAADARQKADELIKKVDEAVAEANKAVAEVKVKMKQLDEAAKNSIYNPARVMVPKETKTQTCPFFVVMDIDSMPSKNEELASAWVKTKIMQASKDAQMGKFATRKEAGELATQWHSPIRLIIQVDRIEGQSAVVAQCECLAHGEKKNFTWKYLSPQFALKPDDNNVHEGGWYKVPAKDTQDIVTEEKRPGISPK